MVIDAKFTILLILTWGFRYIPEKEGITEKGRQMEGENDLPGKEWVSLGGWGAGENYTD